MDNDFIKWFLICVRDKYADFKGRARRREFWMYTLVYIVLAIIIGFIGGIIGTSLLSIILWLALLCPGMAVGVRRMHDIGKSGKWILIALIPIIGALYLLYLATLDSQPGANKWGENPKN